MKRWNLPYVVLAAALLAGLAHLRSDWLGGARGCAEPADVRPAECAATSAAWALRQNESHTRGSFLRPR